MSALNERNAMRAKMEALADDIIALEAMARELARASADLAEQLEVEALHAMARPKQVQALEQRGQLAALHEEYAVRVHLKP
jgi:hypothetical protein